MPIELVVAQELLTRRVRGSFRLYDSDARVEPCHDFGVTRAEQFTLAEALSGGHLWHTQFRVKPHDQTVKILRRNPNDRKGIIVQPDTEIGRASCRERV